MIDDGARKVFGWVGENGFYAGFVWDRWLSDEEIALAEKAMLAEAETMLDDARIVDAMVILWRGDFDKNFRERNKGLIKRAWDMVEERSHEAAQRLARRTGGSDDDT